MTKNDTLKELFTLLINSFLGKPAECEIKFANVGNLVSLSARPHPDDFGKLNGTKGVMYRATETLLAAAGTKLGVTVRYTMLEGRGVRSQVQHHGFTKAEHWDSKEVSTLITEIGRYLFACDFKVSTLDMDNEDTTILVLELDAAEYLKEFDLRQIKDALGIVFLAVGKIKGRSVILVDVQKP